MSTVVKSLATDFGGSWNQSQLHTEIVADVAITTTLIGINHESGSDVINIVFESTLSGPEDTALNDLIANHTPDNSKPKKTFYVVQVKKQTVTSSSYYLAAHFRYGGSDVIGTIDYIDLLAYKDSNITSYDARIVNKTTGQILVEKTAMTNNEIAIIDLGTISNVPTSSTILELQVKRNGGNNNSNVNIDQLIVYHGN